MANLFSNKQTIIAVIGFGRFGRVLVDILSNHSNASILLVTSQKKIPGYKNVKVGKLNEIKDADIVFPCVPISEFENVLRTISNIIKKNAVVIDVCSVKSLPVKVMKKSLPKSAQIISSHPMFGPDSYRIKKNLEDLRLVLWNISAQKDIFKQIKDFFKNLGLRIVELSPEEHDKQMAYSLGYSYLIGKIGQRMDIKPTDIDTYDFQLVLEQIGIVKSDTDQLFFDMQIKNPYAKEVRKKVISTLHELQSDIGQRET